MNERICNKWFPNQDSIFDINYKKFNQQEAVDLHVVNSFRCLLEKVISTDKKSLLSSSPLITKEIKSTLFELEKKDFYLAYTYLQLSNIVISNNSFTKKKLKRYIYKINFNNTIKKYKGYKLIYGFVKNIQGLFNNVFRSKRSHIRDDLYLKNLLGDTIKYNPEIDDAISIKERIAFYLGDSLNYNLESLTRYKNEIETFEKIILYKYQEGYKQNLKSAYPVDMDRVLSRCLYTESVFVLFGDKVLNNLKVPLFIKARDINGDNNGIILKLNSKRHWDFREISSDVGWESKLDRVIWRGANTGVESEYNDRYKLVKNYSSKYNIGFSKITKKKKLLREDLVIRGNISKEEQLKYKYIISIEGNDVASNLKWILASNSVVIMKKPTKETWLMESKIQPYKHYVPLSENMDNLEEVLTWCKNNDNKCKQIAINGKRYMNMFFNIEREAYIEKRVLEEYIKIYAKKDVT